MIPLQGLLRKEFLQIIRDPSSIVIAFVLPVVLLLLFTYAISLDFKRVSIALVVEENDQIAESCISAFQGSKYFNPKVLYDRISAEHLLLQGKIAAFVVIPSEFPEKVLRAQKPAIQVIIKGTDGNSARLIKKYIEATIFLWYRNFVFENSGIFPSDPIEVEARVWFNEQADFRVSLIPGSIAVIMTLIGTMLTALVVAREWERETIETLIATKIPRSVFLLSKVLPYYALGILGMGIVSLYAVVVLHIPIRGSILMLFIVSSAFLCYALGLGVLISTVAKNQFLATQASLVIGFLPAFILSGLVFEIQSMPKVIQYITYAFAPRYFVSSLRTIFLAGNQLAVLIPNLLAIIGFAVLFFTLASRRTKMLLG